MEGKPARRIALRAAERDLRLLGPGAPPSRVWTFGGDPWPVIRVRKGERIVATLHNDLPEHTTIHWHGIRLDNAMDGVPYITQPPVEPGTRFTYDFAPPDTGTFFFHPHCNEAGQVGHGLAGVLIVEGDEATPFDAETLLVAKDWRLDADGRFLPLVTDRGAARGGTFGTLRSVNGAAPARHAVPARADLRVRLLNLDSTRILEAGVEGAEAAILAIDGNSIPPLPLDTWRMGPAMRLDLVLRTPAAGATARLVDYNVAEPFTLAEFAAEGEPLRSGPLRPRALIPSALPEPDLGGARALAFELGSAAAAPPLAAASPEDALSRDLAASLCLGERTFWAINGASWPIDGHRMPPPPLATLKRGASYRFLIRNATPHPHPIHLHGHTFKVLSSSRRRHPPYWADTVLIDAKERVEIAFVARRGDWMFHCHILEHIETGMMGYLRVA